MRPPIPASTFWGKAEIDRGNGAILSWHPLTDHCLDVAVTFRTLAGLPVFKARLEQAAGQALCPTQLDRLAVLALLHDLGKCNLGFQDKILKPKAPPAGHVRELAALFTDDELNARLVDALAIDTLLGWFDPPQALEAFLVASWSHHGTPIHFQPGDQTGNFHLARNRWWRPDSNRDPFQAVAGLMEAAKSAFPAAFSPALAIPECPRLQHRFAGLVMLADWLGSHTGFFPYRESEGEDRLSLAVRNAKAALRTVGLDPRPWQADLDRRPAAFAERFGLPAPRPLQTAIAELPACAPESRLLIAEAETGSGKTEAALARFFTLFAAAAVDSLYFALPTRVAARELYGRVRSYVERAFPDPESRPAVLLAVPGYAQVDGVPAQQLLPPDKVRWHDADRQRREERAWAAERPKRFLAATVAVGTVDQALLSALQTRHAHLRSVCLDRSLLVVDEVHASDPYMRRLLRTLLQHHLGLGGHALLLSATLGAAARAEFLTATGGQAELPPFRDACAAPYPSLTDRSGSPRAVGEPAPKATGKQVWVELHPHLADPQQLLPEIGKALAAGARVLVVLNTVNRAVGFQRAAEAAVPKTALFHCRNIIAPHHGRFAPADREILDLAVSDRLGKGSPPGSLLLIGTQTLEQSLDIDADLLITDLCPMDVLLQRIGRLHRHARERPKGFAQARCLVLVPPDPDLETLLDAKGRTIGEAKKTGLGSVYEDLRTVQLTRDLLAANPELSIPADNRRLVEGATHPERLDGLEGERWRKHGQDVDGQNLAKEIRAHYAALGEIYERSFGEFAFNDLNAEARTRLGLDTLHLPLSEPLTSPFGQRLAEVVIPGHLAPKKPDLETAAVLAADGESTVLSLGDRRYRYSRFGLEVIDESVD